MRLSDLWRAVVRRWKAPKMRTIAAVKGIEATSETFRARLCDIGERLGIEPDWLAAVISIETVGTFSAAIRNPRSGYVGLIQFGPRAAANVGTSCDSLSKMANVEQLKFVEAFYRPIRTKVRSVEQAYLAVFAPSYIDAAPSAACYVAPSKAYEQNRELDTSGDGTITVAEATAPARRVLAAAQTRPRLPANPLPWAGAVGSILVLAALAAAWRAFS